MRFNFQNRRMPVFAVFAHVTLFPMKVCSFLRTPFMGLWENKIELITPA
jgi:hypothetical protein